MPPSPTPSWRGHRHVPAALVLAACLFNAVVYRHALTIAAPEMNDHMLHYALVEGARQAWARGDSMHDFWLALWGEGFPVARYYQNLPHVAVVLAHVALGGLVPLPTLYRAAVLGGLVALPPALAAGARALGMSAVAAAFVAVCGALLGADRSAPYFLGMQADKYLSLHGGMFPQLFGLVALALTVGVTQRALVRDRRLGLAILCLSATWLSHLLLGYAASLLAGLALVRAEARGQVRRVALRLGTLYAATFVVIAPQLVPALRDDTLLSRSSLELPAYWDGFGLQGLLVPLLQGKVFDDARWPILSGLVLLGLVGALLPACRDRAEGADAAERSAARFAAGAFVLVLLCALGRPVLGVLTGLLPFAHKLPLHRFVCLVQYAGLLLSALPLAALFRALRWEESRGRTLLAGGTALLLLSPCLAERVRIAQENATARARSAYWYRRNHGLLRSHFDKIRALSREHPGRSYAGSSWNWGGGFGIATLPFHAYWAREALPCIGANVHTMSLNSDLDVLFDPSRRDHYDFFNLRFVVAPDRDLLPAFAAPVHGSDGLWTAAVDTRGYFDVVRVGHLLDVPGRGDRITEFGGHYLRSTWHAKREAVRVRWRDRENVDPALVPLPPDAPLPELEARAPAGEVEHEREQDGRFEATVAVREPATLLFRMTYHPSWRVLIDGVPHGPVMLAPSFMGVPLPPGRHHVAFRYGTDPLRQALMGPSLFVLGAALWRDFRRRRAA